MRFGRLRFHERPPGALGFLSLALVAAACSGEGVPRGGPPLPPRPASVGVTMSEYRFDVDATIPAGRVVFRVRNAGRLDHHLSLFPLAEEVPPLDVQLHGPQRRVLTPFGAMPVLRPGQSGSLAVDLVPGRRYALICFLRDPGGGEVHALKGMHAEFRASQAGGPSQAPTTTQPG